MPEAPTRLPRALALLSACLLCLPLVACGGDDDSGGGEPAAGAPEAAFPRTIKHKLGTTEIPEKPERVVTLGPIERDLAAALDVDLVGAGLTERNNPDRKPPPWLTPELKVGATKTFVLKGIPYEQIAALKPDVILAQSGEGATIDKAKYDKLSQIAPTVVYQKGPAMDSWQQVSRTAGKALGLEAQVEPLIERTEARLEDAASSNPEFSGKTFMVSNVFGADKVGALISDKEATVKLLSQFGFKLSPNAREVGGGEPGAAQGMIAPERLDLLDADVLFLNFAVPAARKELESATLFKRLDVVRRHAVVRFEPDEWAALRDPSVLSLPYVLDKVLPRLQDLDFGDGR